MTSNDDGAQKSKPGLFRRLFSPTEPEAPPQAPEAAPAAAERSWLSRLTGGLSRSSASIGQGIADIFSKRRLDAAALDDLEDVLIRADLGLGAATRIREAVARGRYDKAIEDYAEVLRVDPKSVDMYNALGWLRATCPDAKYRDGVEAVRNATNACELTDWKDTDSLDTLARAAS